MKLELSLVSRINGVVTARVLTSARSTFCADSGDVGGQEGASGFEILRIEKERQLRSIGMGKYFLHELVSWWGFFGGASLQYAGILRVR